MASVTPAWREHSLRLAAAMAQALGASDPVHQDDLPVVLWARPAVLDLLRDTYQDATGLSRHGTWRDLAASAPWVHPVGRLALELEQVALPASSLSPLQALGAEVRGPAGAVWQSIGQEAVLCLHEWQRLSPATRQTGDAGWTAVNEVAQLAQGMSWLDEQVAVALRDGGRTDEAAAVAHSARSIRSATSSVIELARSGPLPDIAVAELRSPPSAALVVRHESHVAEALDRLSRFLEGAEHVGPRHVQGAYRVVGVAAARAVELLQAVGPVRAPYGDRQEGELLAGLTATAWEVRRLSLGAAAASGRAASLTNTDGLVVMQTQLIERHFALQTAGAVLTEWTANPGRTSALARMILSATTRTVTALHRATQQAIVRGDWFVPRSGPVVGTVSWTRSRPHHTDLEHHECPTLWRASSKAIVRSQHLADQLTDPTERKGPRPALRRVEQPCRGGLDLLAAALRDAERRAAPIAVRPTHPGMRPQP